MHSGLPLAVSVHAMLVCKAPTEKKSSLVSDVIRLTKSKATALTNSKAFALYPWAKIAKAIFRTLLFAGKLKDPSTTKETASIFGSNQL